MDTRIVCLAVLERGAASGYEIKKALEEAPHLYFQDISFGALYPALGRLAEAGLVEVAELAQEKRPDKKVYTITEAGRAALRRALCQFPAPDRIRSDFLFLLMHGDLVPAEHLLAVVDRRIEELEAAAAQMRDCDTAAAAPSRKLLYDFGLDYYVNSARFLRSHRDALRRALEAPAPRAAE